jgi:HK97 family phage major capsid protein
MATATAGTGLPATATKSLLFGVLPRYKVRRVRDVRMYRLTERYRDTDQDGFVAFMRLDGKLLNAGTCPVKHLLQA